MLKLEDLNDKTIQALKWVSVEFKLAKDLRTELQELENDSNKEIKIALKILKWIGRAEKKSNKSLSPVEQEMEKIVKILPSELKIKEEDLVQKLKTQENKLIELASRFGELAEDFKNIKLTKQLLIKVKNVSNENVNLKQKLKLFTEKAEEDITSLMEWITSTESTLQSIRGFEQTLQELEAM